MKLFSDCNGCIVCLHANGCIAGHGDDFFFLAGKDELVRRFNEENLSQKDKEIIRSYLLKEYSYNV